MHPAEIAGKTPDKVAIRLGQDTRTYRELDERSDGVARLLAGRGLSKGDIVALWAGNDIDFLCCTWAAQRSGLYYLALSANLTAPEAAYILGDSGAKALITDTARARKVPDVLAEAPELEGLQCFCLGDAPNLPLVWEAARDCADVAYDPCEGGDMLYTSGTTGKPKGVLRPLSFGPLGSDSRRVERTKALFRMTQDTVFLSPAPLYHAAPLRFTMTVLRLGGEVALMQRFDPQKALSTIMETRATHTQWVPTMFARMLALPKRQRDAFRAPSHVQALHSGAPCPRNIKQRMIDWWGPVLHEYYSGSESVGFTHIESQDWMKRPGSVGQPWGCKIHILDAAEQELGPHQTGMVYFEGKAGLVYHNAAAKTRAAYSAQGWATMGDVGHVDEDGFLYLTDRKAFTIISGGVNVYPREVEDLLIDDPAVNGAAVFGVPDADFGEAVQAVVEPVAGVDEATLAAKLFNVCHQNLSPPKRPKRIAFKSPLPLTDSGKIQKRVLQAAYAAPESRGYSMETVPT